MLIISAFLERDVSFDHTLIDPEQIAAPPRLITAPNAGVFRGERSEQLPLRNIRPDLARQRRGHCADTFGNHLINEILWCRVVTTVMPDLVKRDSPEHLLPLWILHHGVPSAPLRIARK